MSNIQKFSDECCFKIVNPSLPPKIKITHKEAGLIRTFYGLKDMRGYINNLYVALGRLESDVEEYYLKT